MGYNATPVRKCEECLDMNVNSKPSLRFRTQRSIFSSVFVMFFLLFCFLLFFGLMHHANHAACIMHACPNARGAQAIINNQQSTSLQETAEGAFVPRRPCLLLFRGGWWQMAGVFCLFCICSVLVLVCWSVDVCFYSYE